MSRRRVVKPGGHIICVAECWDGIPEHGNFKKLLAGLSPGRYSNTSLYPWFCPNGPMAGPNLSDDLRRAKVHMYSDCLTAEQIRLAHLEPVQSVEELLKILAEKPGALFAFTRRSQTIPTWWGRNKPHRV